MIDPTCEQCQKTTLASSFNPCTSNGKLNCRCECHVKQLTKIPTTIKEAALAELEIGNLSFDDLPEHLQKIPALRLVRRNNELAKELAAEKERREAAELMNDRAREIIINTWSVKPDACKWMDDMDAIQRERIPKDAPLSAVEEKTK